MSATPHRAWCAEGECLTGQDGHVVHLSAGQRVDLSVGDRVTVCLVDRGDGIEVQLDVGVHTVGLGVVLTPELADEVGQALRDHARRARDG